LAIALVMTWCVSLRVSVGVRSSEKCTLPDSSPEIKSPHSKTTVFMRSPNNSAIYPETCAAKPLISPSPPLNASMLSVTP